MLGAAAACATLDVIKEEGLLENANERGAQLVKVGSFDLNLILQPAHCTL